MSSSVDIVTRAYVATRRFAVRRIRYFFFCSLIMASCACGKTNYYVSSSTGNNSNNGTSPKTAWQTLDKVYSKSPAFQPGDSILIMRGDTLDGQFNVTLNGTAQSPIVIGAYGTGEKPLIVGNLSKRTWTATPGRPGYYQIYVGPGVSMTRVYEYYDGAWNIMTKKNEPQGSRSAWLDTMGVDCWGPSAWSDTLWLHTHNSGILNPNSLRPLRDGSLLTGSHVVVRDLDLRYSHMGLYVSNASNFIIRNVSVRNTTSIAIYLHDVISNCLVDSCSTDSGAYTAIYNYLGTNNVFRANHVSHVLDNYLGIPVTAERCGIGLQGGASPAYGTGRNNLVEYNTFENIYDSGVDMYWSYGDTIRYNTFTNMGGGLWPNGTNLVFLGNTINAVNGINITNYGPGTVALSGNTINFTGTGIAVSANDNGGTTTISGNKISGSPEFVQYGVSGMATAGNTYLGSGSWTYLGTTYHALSLFQAATGLEKGSVSYSGPPTGTFSVTPDSLPSEGGTVTLLWSTSNATSAAISPVIGNVAVSGSRSTSVLVSTVFALALSGPFGSTTYNARVVVGAQSDSAIPLKYGLSQNYPNPFNPSTTIEFTVPTDSYTSLKVFDALGREIATLAQGMQSRGTHRFRWDAKGKASGVYLYRLTVDSYTDTHRMMLLR
jgi:hypothetical protein